MFMELVQLALNNLLRARTRLIMTAGGVLVGTTAVIMLVALTFGLQRAAEQGIGSNAALTEIRVYPNWGTDGSAPDFTLAAVQEFWNIPGVEVVLPFISYQGSAELRADDYVNYAQILGISEQLLPYMGIEISEGVLSLGNEQVLVGASVGDYFFDPEAEEWQPVAIDLMNTRVRLQLFSFTGDDRRIDLEIMGKIAPGNFMYDGALLMAIEDVISLNEWASGERIDPDTMRLDQVIVRAADREATQAITEAIRELGYQTDGLGDFLNEVNNFFTTMRLMLGGVGGIALLVAAFGVANTMTMAILERTKEIGLMKAIGARDRDVLTVFLIEAGLVGLTGGLAGVGLSLFLQNIVNQALANSPQEGGGVMFLPFDPSQIGGQLLIIPPELSLFAIVLATSVGLGAGLFPALRAARLAPVVALKTE